MPEDKTKIKSLREKIDAIDREMHRLIMQRTEIVDDVRSSKDSQKVLIRPSREAEILYRLTHEHRGGFPKRELARIWREMIVATLSFEGPFAVAVLETEEESSYRDLARDQYGTFTTIVRHASARAVVEAVREQVATLGVLPFPHRHGDEPWWRFLLSEAPETPKIIARLPFIPGSNIQNQDSEALVICPIEQEKTGRDRTFLAVEAEEEIGYPRIETGLSKVGFSNVFHQLWHDPNRPPGWTYLVEAIGFLDINSLNWQHFCDELGSRATRILHLGGYATPLTDTDLQSRFQEQVHK